MLQHSPRALGPFPQLSFETFLSSARQVARDLTALQSLYESELAGFENLGLKWASSDDVRNSGRKVTALTTALESLAAALADVRKTPTTTAERAVAISLGSAWHAVSEIPCQTPQVSLRKAPSGIFSFAFLFEGKSISAKCNGPQPEEKAFCKACGYDLIGTIGTIRVEQTGRPVTRPETAKAALEAGHTLTPACHCPDCNHGFSPFPVISPAQRQALEVELQTAQEVLINRGHRYSPPERSLILEVLARGENE